MKKAGRIADFVPSEVKPIVSAENIIQPVLIAHGDSDDNISIAYGVSFFKALKT